MPENQQPIPIKASASDIKKPALGILVPVAAAIILGLAGFFYYKNSYFTPIGKTGRDFNLLGFMGTFRSNGSGNCQI